MITANKYPALLAALLGLGACAKADDDATEAGSAGQTTTASTTASTATAISGDTIDPPEERDAYGRTSRRG